MAVASWCLASEKVHDLTLSGTGILKSFYEDDLLPFFLGSFNSFFISPYYGEKGCFFSFCVMSKMFFIDVNTKDIRDLYRRRPSDLLNNICV